MRKPLTEQRVKFERPPHFKELIKVLPGARMPGVIFAWGETVYNPGRVTMTPALKAHELLHGQRQLAYPGGTKEWWARYMADPEFRLEEEIVAHRMEYMIAAAGRNRHDRRLLVKVMAAKLRNPMYGYKLKLRDAERLLANNPKKVPTLAEVKEAAGVE